MNISQGAFVALAAIGLASCTPLIASTPSEFAEGPPPVSAATPYSNMVSCVAAIPMDASVDLPTVAVGNIVDATGKTTYGDDGFGSFMSQAPGHMAYSVIWKSAMAHPVERVDVSVMEFENRLAMSKRLGNGPSEVHLADGTLAIVQYRPVEQGAVIGSRYYLAGAITALDLNTGSQGVEASIAGIGGGARVYRAVVAIDLRLVDTISGEVVASEAIHKEIVGSEVTVGVGRFFGSTFFSLNGGAQESEPLSIVLRSMLQLGMVKMLAKATDRDISSCLTLVEGVDGVVDVS